MATNYPTWNTYHGHGEPVTGYYWGDDPRGPAGIDDGIISEYGANELGRIISVWRMEGDTPHRVTFPWDKSFWWSSELPSIEWWRERAIARGREPLAIEPGRVPPDTYLLDDPWSSLIGRRVTVRLPRNTRELTSVAQDRRRMAANRAIAEERAQTAPINHDMFRHPLQGKPNGQESEYSWLLHGPLVAVRNTAGSVLVYKQDGTKAAVVREEWFQIQGGPRVAAVTVNGQVFQWGMESNKLMYIIEESAEPRKPESVLWPEDAGATRAPGQANDNVVIRLDCGHIMDMSFEPGAQTEFWCAPCKGVKNRVFPPGGQRPY